MDTLFALLNLSGGTPLVTGGHPSPSPQKLHDEKDKDCTEMNINALILLVVYTMDDWSHQEMLCWMLSLIHALH